MSPDDPFGQDPGVRRMRRLFAALEAAAEDYLAKAGLEELDPRLGSARRRARDTWERVWPRAVRQGLLGDDQQAAALYLCCLARALGPLAAAAPCPADPALAALLEEAGP